ncbi:MAG: hypothetical protein JNM43_05630 [Planctomycetaceae bacterium]|nr:hypothetical protein [Planctomycetaceae bacterium]
MSANLRNLVFLLTLMTLLNGCQESFDKTTLRPDASGHVPWKDAQRAILSGAVVGVTQTHSKEVSFTFDDGSTFRTKEDRIDEVLDLIKDNHLEDTISIVTE